MTEGSQRRLLQWSLACVFLAAGLLKLVDPTGFALSIARHELVPDALVSPMAILLPWVEVVAALALLALPSYREAALVILLTLLLVFTAALFLNIVRGLATPCGCFGRFAGLWQHPWLALTRNAVLVALALVLFAKTERAQRAT